MGSKRAWLQPPGRKRTSHEEQGDILAQLFIVTCQLYLYKPNSVFREYLELRSWALSRNILRNYFPVYTGQ